MRYSTTFGYTKDDQYLFITDRKTGTVRSCLLRPMFSTVEFKCQQWVDLITVREPERKTERIEPPRGK